MYRNKVVYLLLVVCCSTIICEGVPTEISDLNANCEQYANDLEIISKFPFTMNLDPQKQGPGISTAFLDPTGSQVNMIQLRQAGATVPNSVFCLKNLESLDIMNMNFINGIVPDTLSNLPLLFDLTITNSPITKFTDEVTKLQRLEMLTVDNCGLTEMPNLYGMPNLYVVSLPNNRLSKLEGLMNVYRLFLYNNLFTEVPTQTQPGRLAVLYMNYNPVQNMPNIVSHFNLTEVRLAKTQVSAIPSNINDLKYLSFLDLSFSKITQVPETILKVARLQFLVIQGNEFSAQEVDAIKTEFQAQRPDVNLLI